MRSETPVLTPPAHPPTRRPPPVPGAAGIIILPGVTGSEPNQFASIFGVVVKGRHPAIPVVHRRQLSVPEQALLSPELVAPPHRAAAPPLTSGPGLHVVGIFLCVAILHWAEGSTSLGNSMDSAQTAVEGEGVAGPEFFQSS